MTRISIAIAFACALVLVPQAAAKGPVSVCGQSGCAPVGTEGASIAWWGGAYASHVAPAAPAPFFALRFGDVYQDPVAYWVPSAGVLRVVSASGPAVWVRPSAEDVAALEQATASLQPFAPPQTARVAVDGRPVRHGRQTYMRLFTTGAPVLIAVGAKGWLPIDFHGGETPWTDAYAWMWISKAHAYLKHPDGDVLRISPSLAGRIRHRLPLDG